MPDHTDTYGSIAELADIASKHVAELFGDPEKCSNPKFYGVKSWTQTLNLATHGWQDVETDVLEIVDTSISSVEGDQHMGAFTPVWGVTGSVVDIGRYLSGEPENMIGYEVTPVTRAGRVITLCASVAVSSGITQKQIRKRGYGIAGLAFALSRLGYAVELWADLSAREGVTIGRIRTLVKGANDELDPAKIMFAYAHPAMLRALMLSAMHEFPAAIRDELVPGGGYGCPTDPKQDLPDGTIYLDSVTYGPDIPEPADMLRDQLIGLGIIE